VWDLPNQGEGALDGGWQGDVSKNFNVASLPLFGEDSVIGRSITIHKADGTRFVCATIVDASAPATAKATFEGELEGSVEFTQYASDSPTVVEVDFNAVAHVGATWQVHAQQPQGDAQCDDGSVGPKYLSARVWDLSRSLGTLGGTMHLSKNVWSLPLFGSQGLAGRSIVVYEPTSKAPYACAAIEGEIIPQESTAGFAHFIGDTFGDSDTDDIPPRCQQQSSTTHINSACCGDGTSCTESGIPDECSVSCAPIFVDFWNSCKDLFKGNKAVGKPLRKLKKKCEDVIAAGPPPPSSSVDNLGTGCPWGQGDGTGGTEERLGSAPTPQDCVDMVNAAAGRGQDALLAFGPRIFVVAF
jgi:hypothetical protein